MIAVLLGMIVAAPAVQAAPPSTPFSGAWIGQDPPPPAGDGSTVHLIVEGGENARIVFTDEFGSVCLNEGAPVTFFWSFLTGKVDGDTLNARFKLAKCGTHVVGFLVGLPYSLAYDDNETLDPSDDTLLDSEGVLWHRDD
jgi:hypothetical protein